MSFKNSQGFTLLELIIVMIILGIFSVVAVPRYMGMQREAKIAATKGKLAAIRGALELAHAKILVSGVNTGTTGDNPDWPTIEEVQFNSLVLETRPESIRNLKLVRSEFFSTEKNKALPQCNLPDMLSAMSQNPSAVTQRTLADIEASVRLANEASCWAYYPGDERDENGRVVDAIFYVNDDRPFTDNIDAADLRPSQW